MALEWLWTWLYAIVPSTAEKNVQELSLPYDSDSDDDAESVATLETAFEQQDNTHSFRENDTTPSNTDFHDRGIDTDHSPIIIQGNRWPQLIEKYGTHPGSPIMLGKIEVFDLHLSFKSSFLYAYRKRVQEFSGAEIAIYDNPPRPFEASLRLTGTVENAFYAIQAYNAILDTTTIPDRKVWVTLTLKGPRMIAAAEALKQRLAHILPEDGFVPADKLHVTIGLVDPKPHRRTHKQLYELIQSLTDGLNNTEMNKAVVGYFNRVRACQPTRLSMVPTNDRDPISVVARKYTVHFSKA
ncbi:hypothetical protein BJV82DRAFT_619839 [Fennellomyces sp. T-0311]|nr:hypothetical protein BJV82DRAFT_619839 [Fennellomyces sp. T-0311]